MSWLATPAKASRMRADRCTRRWATVVAVLNLRSTFCCRSLSTTFAAEPALAPWLASLILGSLRRVAKHPSRWETASAVRVSDPARSGRVVAAGVPGVAAADAADALAGPAHRAVLV